MVPMAYACVRVPFSDMARGKGANFSRRKRSFMASLSGRRDAKSRAASLLASVARMDFPPAVTRTRVAKAMFLPMEVLHDPRSSKFRAFFKCVFGNRHGGKHVRPSDIEGEMRERLGDLGLRQTIIHADVRVAGQLSH